MLSSQKSSLTHDFKEEIKNFMTLNTLSGKKRQEFYFHWEQKTQKLVLNQYLYHPRMWFPYLHDKEVMKYWEMILEKMQGEKMSLEELIEKMTYIKATKAVKLSKNAFYVFNALLDRNTEDYQVIVEELPKKISKQTYYAIKKDLLERNILYKTPYVNVKVMGLKSLMVILDVWEYDSLLIQKIMDIPYFFAAYVLNPIQTKFLLFFLVPAQFVSIFITEFNQLKTRFPIREITYLEDDATRIPQWKQAYNFKYYDYQNRKWDINKLFVDSLITEEETTTPKTSFLKLPDYKKYENQSTFKLNHKTLQYINTLLRHPNITRKKLREILGVTESQLKHIVHQVKQNWILTQVFQPNIDAFNLEFLVIYGINFHQQITNIKPLLQQPMARIAPVVTINSKRAIKGSLVFVVSLPEIIDNIIMILKERYQYSPEDLILAKTRFKPVKWIIPEKTYNEEKGWIWNGLYE